MKRNKTMISLLLLISYGVAKSEIGARQIKPVIVREPVKVHPTPSVPMESSDEEIMAEQQFTGKIHERTESGMPRLRKTAPTFAEVSQHYKRWTSVDKLGAAAGFKPSSVS